jgi:hypothetical protein
MNVLERWVDEELTRIPPGPSAGELRRRARVRRARRGGAMAAVSVVLVLAVTAVLQSPGSRQVNVIAPAPEPTMTTATPTSTLPVATTAEFPPLAKIISNVIGNVQSNTDPKAVVTTPTSAEIVATTNARANALWGGTTDEKPIYIVQVIGRFLCETCHGPVNSKAPRGSALQVFFDTGGNGFGFGLSATPKDLSTLGAVYRLPLP